VRECQPGKFASKLTTWNGTGPKATGKTRMAPLAASAVGASRCQLLVVASTEPPPNGEYRHPGTKDDDRPQQCRIDAGAALRTTTSCWGPDRAYGRPGRGRLRTRDVRIRQCRRGLRR
jgi:hypothetical protein